MEKSREGEMENRKRKLTQREPEIVKIKTKQGERFEYKRSKSN